MKKNIGVFIDHDLMIHFIKQNKFKELEKYNVIYFFQKKKELFKIPINLK